MTYFANNERDGRLVGDIVKHMNGETFESLQPTEDDVDRAVILQALSEGYTRKDFLQLAKYLLDHNPPQTFAQRVGSFLGQREPIPAQQEAFNELRQAIKGILVTGSQTYDDRAKSDNAFTAKDFDQIIGATSSTSIILDVFQRHGVTTIDSLRQSDRDTLESIIRLNTLSRDAFRQRYEAHGSAVRRQVKSSPSAMVFDYLREILGGRQKRK